MQVEAENRSEFFPGIQIVIGISQKVAGLAGFDFTNRELNAPCKANLVETLLFEAKTWLKESLNRDILSCLRHLRKVSIPNSIEFDHLIPGRLQKGN